MSNRRPDYRNRMAEDRKRELLLNLSQCELVRQAKEERFWLEWATVWFPAEMSRG